MRIDVVMKDSRAEIGLTGVDDFTRFSVRVVGKNADLPALRALCPALGHADEMGDVFVARSGLIELAGPTAEGPMWLSSLASVIAFAPSQGWTDQTGAIRVHVEYGAADTRSTREVPPACVTPTFIDRLGVGGAPVQGAPRNDSSASSKASGASNIG